MRRFLTAKAGLLLLAAAGFYGGWQAAHFPGPRVARFESHRIDGGGVTGSYYSGPDDTYPLVPVSYGFLGFGAVCALAAAWAHAAEVRSASRPSGRAEGDGWELVMNDAEPSAAPDRRGV